MYPVSAAYRAAIKANTRTVKIAGTITLNDESTIEFSDADIVAGSLYRQFQCASGEDIDIGSVCVSDLGLALITPQENPYALDGARVYVNFGIEVADGLYEYVPLGYYYVTGIERKNTAVSLKCMDGLIRFDVDLYDVLTSGDAYQLISSCCDKAGIVLAMSQQDFAAFANHAVVWSVPQDSKIKTCRDLIMWLCQMLGAFARMNREGLLEICTMGTTPVRTITGDERYPGMAMSDTIVRVTKVEMTIGQSTYSQGVDGMTMRLDANPLLAGKTDAEINACLAALLAQVSQVAYTPGKFEMPGDPALDAGDMLLLTGARIADTQMMLSKSTWRYRGKQTIQSVGQNAMLKAEYSQAQKAITAIALIAEAAKTLALSANQSAQLINDAIGGNVWIRKNEARNEILIMDSADPDTAVKIWRWNMAGLGYSDNCVGVDNPARTYKIAMTMDGAINADFITTGTLLADRIVGGTLRLTGTSGTFLIAGSVDKQRIFIGSDSHDEPFLTVYDSNNTPTTTINKRGLKIGESLFAPYSTPRSSGVAIHAG